MLESTVRAFSRPLLIVCLFGSAAAIAGESHTGGLRDALQATLRNHPAVAGQAAEVDASRYASDALRSQRYPTLSAQAQHYTEGLSSTLSGDDLRNPSVFRVRQPIYAFGRINDSITAANAEVGTQRADLLRVRRQLLEATAVTYSGMRGSREQIDVARQNVTQVEELHAQILRRVEGERASEADARLAATRLTQSRAQLERAISEWEIAGDDLASLTQRTISADEPVPPELLDLPESRALIERALEESADIQLKRQQLKQADAEVDKARTSYMPTIYLQADRFHDQPGLPDDNRVSVVLEASLDGMGFAARGRTGEAVANRTAAMQDLANTTLDLKRELERLQNSRNLQSELVQLQTLSLRDLESLLASYQRQYESGSKSWLDLMNIQRELSEQRHQLVQAQNDWMIYSLQLQARIGGLDALAGIEEQSDD